MQPNQPAAQMELTKLAALMARTSGIPNVKIGPISQGGRTMHKRICSGILIAMIYLLGQGFAAAGLAEAATPKDLSDFPGGNFQLIIINYKQADNQRFTNH